MVEENCYFCTIGTRKSDREIEFENNNAVVIRSIRPRATYHFLVIPKKHITNFSGIEKKDHQVISDMISAAQQVVKNHLIKDFRVAFNGGKYIEVQHLHMHVFSGTDEEMQNFYRKQNL